MLKSHNYGKFPKTRYWIPQPCKQNNPYDLFLRIEFFLDLRMHIYFFTSSTLICVLSHQSFEYYTFVFLYEYIHYILSTVGNFKFLKFILTFSL